MNSESGWRKQGHKPSLGFTSLTDEFVHHLKEQNNRCACCRLPFKFRSGSPDPRQLEHDHRTGRVRGVVCGSCNMWIAQLYDDYFVEGENTNEILLRAIEDLTNHYEAVLPDEIETADHDEILEWLEIVGKAQLVSYYIEKPL